jgi:hypothetical protein
MPDFAGDTTTELERKLPPLKFVCGLETVSYLLLLLMWLVLHNRIGTMLVGSVHGMIVLAFAGMVFGIHRALHWSLRYVAFAVCTGPIGALVVLHRLRTPIASVSTA